MLSPEDMAILDFERGWWLEPGPKDQAIEMSLGLSSAAYYEMLRDLIDRSDSLKYDPLTTKRVLALVEDQTLAQYAV